MPGRTATKTKALSRIENELRTERVHQMVVERSSQIWDDMESADRYPKMRGLMEDLQRDDLELLEAKMSAALLENDRVLIEAGAYKANELSTSNVSEFKKWHHNCIRLGRLFSMFKFEVSNEAKQSLRNALVKDSMFLNPRVVKAIF